VASGLSVPGDPEALEQLASRLESAAQGAGNLGGSTRQFTTATLSDAEWTGSAADSFSAFGANLGEGAGAAEGPLTQMASAVRTYAGSLRTAQQEAQTFNSIADAAQNDPSGSLISAAEQAGQNATNAISAMQQAGDQAAAKVTSAAGDLEGVFGKGPVQGFIGSQTGLGEDIPMGDWKPGDPMPPEILGNPGAPDLGLPEGDPIPTDLGPEILGNPGAPDLGLPEGDPIPTDLGPEILGNPGGMIGPLINFNTPGQQGDEGDSGQESGGEGGYTPTPGTQAGDFDNDELAWLAHQHVGGGDDTGRPTVAEVEQTLEKGTATNIPGQQAVQVDYTVNGKDVRVIINEANPLRSTTYYPGSLGPTGG
jgi:uncharacterized protein YukE